MPRTRQECAKLVVQTVRREFEEMAAVLLASEGVDLDRGATTPIKNAIDRMLSSDDSFAKSGFSRRVDNNLLKALEAAGLTTDELRQHKFIGHVDSFTTLENFFAADIVGAAIDPPAEPYQP